MSKRFIPFILLTASFLLAACDGYEMIRTDKYFPYGNKRTAGTGVAYVLAQMAPEKDLVLERAPEPQQIVQEIPPPPPVTETPAEQVFREAQTK